MNAIPYERSEEEWDSYDDEHGEDQLPRRQRRKLFTRGSAVLLGAVLCAAGFYAGVRVEKNQLSNSSTTGRGLAASATGGSSATGAGARTGAAGAGARAGGGGSFGGTGAGAAGSAGGLATALGGANGSIGTVSTIDGNTLYVTNTSGNMIKVSLSDATKITKNVSVDKSAIRPGDSVVVRGLKESSGTVSATTVSDTGTGGVFGGGGGGGASGGGGAGASGGGSSSAGSAVSSLFGGGGGKAGAGGAGG
jgi:hypothetical protein